MLSRINNTARFSGKLLVFSEKSEDGYDPGPTAKRAIAQNGQHDVVLVATAEEALTELSRDAFDGVAILDGFKNTKGTGIKILMASLVRDIKRIVVLTSRPDLVVRGVDAVNNFLKGQGDDPSVILFEKEPLKGFSEVIKAFRTLENNYQPPKEPSENAPGKRPYLRLIKRPE